MTSIRISNGFIIAEGCVVDTYNSSASSAGKNGIFRISAFVAYTLTYSMARQYISPLYHNGFTLTGIYGHMPTSDPTGGLYPSRTCQGEVMFTFTLDQYAILVTFLSQLGGPTFIDILATLKLTGDEAITKEKVRGCCTQWVSVDRYITTHEQFIIIKHWTDVHIIPKLSINSIRCSAKNDSQRQSSVTLHLTGGASIMLLYFQDENVVAITERLLAALSPTPPMGDLLEIHTLDVTE